MTVPRSPAAEAAAAILASAPSMLSKIAPYVMGGPGDPIDWSKVAELSTQPLWSSSDQAFLALCALLAGHPVPGTPEPPTFGSRWDRLDGQRQALIAGVLTESAQIAKAEELAMLRRLGMGQPEPAEETGGTVRAIRVRLGPDVPAMVNDPLGRERVGFREGASIHETWLRGRGVWRMQADRVVSSPWLIIAHQEIVRLVGTIDGVSIHGDRLAIVGRPIGDHRLIGRPDPLDNASQNPVAYGEIEDPHR
jgi:hypothetical protein